MENLNLTRRSLLQNSALMAGGLVIGYYIPGATRKAFAQGGPPLPPPAPNAFVQIAPDNSITVVINKLEMGQGVNTSMAQLIAEELECDWTKIRSVSASVNPVYNHPIFQTQMTGGSTALASSWDQHRKIGATMREMLKSAAAKRWGVGVNEVKAEKGFVIHKSKGKLSYGDLAEEANKIPMPENPPLKSPKNFKVIGQSLKRVDAAEKSNGKAIYGMDVRIPGMTYAAVARPPLVGAKIKSMDEAAAKKIRGVSEIIAFDDRVAVIAKNSYAAMKGRDALNVVWEDTVNGKLSSRGLMDSFKAMGKTSGLVAKDTGGVDQALGQANKMLIAEYEFPFLAHACMEPMNCTIHFDGTKCEIWSGHQMPTIDRDTAAKVLGLAPEKVLVNTTYAGGSFGRRANKVSDYVVEACGLAKKYRGPIKVVWSREDDMRGGFYRPMNYHKVTLAFDDKKHLLAWDHRLVGQSVISGSIFEPMMVKNGVEATITEGIADTHYTFPQFRCEQHRMITPVTTLWWRSVGSTHTAFVMETMMDELAEQTGKDPLKLRRELLAKSSRHVAVVDLLVRQTKWGDAKPPRGRAWGVAIHESFDTVVGQVIEASIEAGQPRVHKVWAAVHCGQVVNPDGAKTQVEGAIVYGLSAALHQQIELVDGRVRQGNFNDYPVMRMKDMPEVHVEFVVTHEAPTGLGEPGVPPAAPALANALYKLTGKRLRVLPFNNAEVKA